MPTNKKLGNDFENELAWYLFDKGFWVHRLAQNVAGQPADILAGKGSRFFLIDCKVCTGKTFPLSRVEENQYNAMTLWEERTREFGWFAFKLPEGEIHMISFPTIKFYIREDVKALTLAEIQKEGTPLSDWLRRIC